jgi:hypothetical protein
MSGSRGDRSEPEQGGSVQTMAGSTSELWRNRVAGIALTLFGCWNQVSGVLLPFPTRQKIEGLGARVIGGILILIGLLMLLPTISIRKDGDN